MPKTKPPTVALKEDIHAALKQTALDNGMKVYEAADQILRYAMSGTLKKQKKAAKP